MKSSVGRDEVGRADISWSNRPHNPGPLATGGYGFTFQKFVACYYAVQMLSGEPADGVSFGTIDALALQRRRHGADLDDIVLDVGIGGNRTKFEIEVKSSISFTLSDRDFTTPLQRAYRRLTADGPEKRFALAIDTSTAKWPLFRRLQRNARVEDAADFETLIREGSAEL